jgi:diguanylate cyclase (GGDEF)-like protein/PAS domain S-box-containing protein
VRRAVSLRVLSRSLAGLRSVVDVVRGRSVALRPMASVVAMLVAALLGAWIFYGTFTRYGAGLERDGFLKTVGTAAAFLDPATLAALPADLSAVDEPAHAAVVAALRRARDATQASRYVYLLALRHGEIVFLAEAEDPASPNYSAPGDVYADATPELRAAFATGEAIVEGPVADAWGNWVSGLAPIQDPRDGSTVAMLGIDIDAAIWQQSIDRYGWLGLALAALMVAVVVAAILFAILQYRSRALAGITRRIVEASSVILFRRALATDGRPLTFVSGNIARIGYDPETFVRVNADFELIHPGDRTAVRAAIDRIASGASTAETARLRLRTRDGDYRWYETQQQPAYDARGRINAVDGVLVDIHERVLAEQDLRFANTLLATVSDTSPDAILVVNAENRVISFNRRFTELWNLAPESLEDAHNGSLLSHVTGEMKNPAAFLARVNHFYGHREMTGHDELETTDGRFLDRHTAPLQGPSGDYLGRVWFFRDVTDRKRAEARVQWNAHHDTLTGLANRALFMESVGHATDAARRGGPGFAVLYIDLDHFKDVNDTLGHPIGDELLKAVATRLSGEVRGTDVVARFGGDEFAVIAHEVRSPEDAASLAEALIASLSTPIAIAGNEIRCAASIGIAVYTPELRDAETLLAHADVALYRAKGDERGRYRFFTAAMDLEVRNRVAMISQIRQAIEGDELFLEYQPQVRSESGEIIGVEALVRWQHPIHGRLGPSVFIPIAEASGMIHALGRFVFRAACRQQRRWQDLGIAPATLAVNFSGGQFKRATELEEDVLAVLAETGVPASSVELELTESVLMEASREQRGVLFRLRDAGLRLAIDDFGTGYSSLEYLHRFPADRIKIAQAFVGGIGSAPHSAAIVKATIGLARELGIAIIAEGVETRDQLDLLAEWGCHEVQGYYFARPLPAEAIEPLLHAGRVPAGARLSHAA